MTQDLSNKTLTDAILQITRNQKPETVRQLADQVHQRFPSTQESDILDAILNLQNDGKIHLSTEQTYPANLALFLRNRQAAWYWLTIALTLSTVVSVFTISENAYPFVIIRYALGVIFILWLPGYVFIKTLFPVGLPIKRLDKDLDSIERVALSVGMSLALVPLVALLLNYTPWGIRLTPVILGLTALTLTFATAAAVREYRFRRKTADFDDL